MSSINIESELKAKILETYKIILKKNDTVIIFSDNNTDSDIIESISVINDEHMFLLVKKKKTKYKMTLNKKYLIFIPKKILNDKLLTHEQRIDKIKKLKYLKLFKIFYGDLISQDVSYEQRHTFKYNNIIYNIPLKQYDKLYFYAQFTYKITELKRLNKELNIEQNLSIYFDENMISTRMYNSVFNSIKDIFTK